MGVFLNRDTDCICALATPWGRSAIAVIRLSGLHCGLKIKTLLSPSIKDEDFKTKFVRFTKIHDHQSNPLDQILLLNFPHPRSFTGEDVVEIQCHGSPVLVEAILNAIVSCGIRLAEGGEFSKRAFLNGKMDLIQAESIQQLIEANSLRAVRENLQKLEGFISQIVQKIQTQLMNILGTIEAHLDFPEDDIDSLDKDQLCRELVAVGATIGEKVRESQRVEHLSRIPHCVIIGRPNVGKSTLFNALLETKRSIVSDKAGTTRDYIQEILTIQGSQVLLTDTAGIRPNPDAIEGEGIERSLEFLHTSDLILFIKDACMGWTQEDENLFKMTDGRPRLFIINKYDVNQHTEHWMDQETPLKICSHNAEDIQSVKLRMAAMLQLEMDHQEMFISLNQRQNHCMKETLGSVIAAEALLVHGADLEIVALKIREAMEKLAQMTGVSVDRALLDHLFSQFCIGK
ncbi:MAG: tRNA uridine-5-carboxymethylaminomethyl(34) synthesis GTPase MnmE [Magnetococcus sp. THC-1_WYH]